MPRYRIFYEFYGGDGQDQINAPNEGEALSAARDFALGNVSWGAELVEPATDGDQAPAEADVLVPETSE